MTTPKAEKPKTTFDKGYILQRIDARLASIKSQLEKHRPILDEIVQKQRVLDREWAEKSVPRLERQLKSLKRYAKGEGTKEDAERVSNLGHGYSRSYLSYEDRERKNVSEEAVRKLTREEGLLIHARAYLVEAPVEEYSLTALSRLGLIDAVKFSLNDEAAMRLGR